MKPGKTALDPGAACAAGCSVALLGFAGGLAATGSAMLTSVDEGRPASSPVKQAVESQSLQRS